MPATYSYDPADLATDDVAWLRFTLGDTVADRWLLADEEYRYLVTDNGSKTAAVVPAFDRAIAAAGHQVTATQGEVTQQWKERVESLRLERQRAQQQYPESGNAGPAVAEVTVDYASVALDQLGIGRRAWS